MRLDTWPAAMALAVQCTGYWLAVQALAPFGQVTPPAWLVLYLLSAGAAAVLLRGPASAWSARRWLLWFGYALLLAAALRGANFALDALHGAHRRKADVASHLGGLELWFVLCPGLASVALAGLTSSVLRHRA